MRGLFVYAVYVVVVSTALLQAVSAIGSSAAAVEAPVPTAHVGVSISVIGGSPEQTVFCAKASNSIAADSLVLYTQADLDKLLRDLGCAPP